MGITTATWTPVPTSAIQHACLKCGHDDRAAQGPQLAAICKLLGLKAPRVACSTDPGDNYTVWANPPCGCKDPFHTL